MPKNIICGIILWLVSAIGWLSAAQSKLPGGEMIPLWSKEVVPDLSRSRIFGRSLLLDSNRTGLVFLDDKQLFAYAVDHDLGQLSSRDSPEISSPFRLHLWLLDANSGNVVLTKDWGTRVHESDVRVTSGGVLVRTGETLQLYSRDFTQIQDVALPPPGHNSVLIISVSASGRTLMANQIHQKLNVSHLEVFDGGTLKQRFSWDQVPALYHNYSISDDGVAATSFNSRRIVAAEFGDKSWKVVADTNGFCAGGNVPTLVTNEWFVSGCNALSLMSIDGRVLMADFFASGETPSGKTAVAQGGRFVAVSLDSKTVTKHLLTEASVRLTGTRIAVYDLFQKKRI